MSRYYRRSPHLISYWERRQLVFENYRDRGRMAASPLACEMLDFFDRWRSPAEVAARYPSYTPRSLGRAIAQLARAKLLEISKTTRRPLEPAPRTWDSWSPAAAFFHFSTKDAMSPIEPEESIRVLRRRAKLQPMPAACKRYPRAPQVAMPPPRSTGEFAGVLRGRRTWRHFERAPIQLEHLATLLGVTFGVQSWLDFPRIGRVALKTSPSGGARHPIEAYLLSLRVDSLAPGLYHYDSAAHRLERLRHGAHSWEVPRYLNRQWWFRDAAALVFMTAVFARTQWKYPHPRAYRVVLADAGHLCQTFCLTATWLGLAPFCTMAFSDSAIERALRIDGVSESIIYAAGVGSLAADREKARWPGAAYARVSPNPAAQI